MTSLRIAVISRNPSDRLVAQLNSAGHQATALNPPLPVLNHEERQSRFPRLDFLPQARWIADCMHAFHLLWFVEPHLAAEALRKRKFQTSLLPLVVLETGSDLPPDSPDAIHYLAASSYARRLADLSTGTGIPATLRGAVDLWRERSAAPQRIPRPSTTTPAVTVCIPFFEAPDFFPLALDSLAQQTSSDFTVVAVDDGSPSLPARTCFDHCAAQYAPRGWKFLRQENRGPGAARNRAAAEATSEFLLFLDADDFAAPPLVEKLLQAALLSGDDVLVLPNYGFHSDPFAPPGILYQPSGFAAAESLGDDFHGGSCILANRHRFLSIGGFTTDRGIGFEDYEFHVRCNLRGLRWDILPELHYRYRIPGPSNVSRSTSQYPNQRRVLRHFESQLAGTALPQLPLAFASAYWRHHHAAAEASRLQSILQRRRARPPHHRPGLHLLLFTCYFPYGGNSGWHQRAQQFIRYFGSRYSLTLFTVIDPAAFRQSSRQAMQWLHSVRGVKPTRWRYPHSPHLPARVLDHASEQFLEAVAQFPTEQYHAAILDQIFLAEARRHIHTTLLLNEQNIESSLLRQAASFLPATQQQGPFRDALHQSSLLEDYESKVWSEFPVRAVVSETDRLLMNRRVASGNTVLAPNGADPDSWLPSVSRSTATVLFPAHFGYFPNIDAVDFLLDQIWPAVRKQLPAASLLLAGRDPSPALLLRASRTPGVTVIANPPSMSTIAGRAALIVAPLRCGSGTRLKILEALAWGLPVVSTTLGAEGLDVTDGENALLRDDPLAFAAAIVQLLQDEPLWQRLRHNGRALIQEKYAWDHVWRDLEDALLDLIR